MRSNRPRDKNDNGMLIVALVAGAVGAALGYVAANKPRIEAPIGPLTPLFSVPPMPPPPDRSVLVGSWAVHEPRDAAYWLTECVRLRGTDKPFKELLRAAKGWHRGRVR